MTDRNDKKYRVQRWTLQLPLNANKEQIQRQLKIVAAELGYTSGHHKNRRGSVGEFLAAIASGEVECRRVVADDVTDYGKNDPAEI